MYLCIKLEGKVGRHLGKGDVNLGHCTSHSSFLIIIAMIMIKFNGKSSYVNAPIYCYIEC